MGHDTAQTLIAMLGYMAIVIGIGLYFSKRSNSSSEEFFLGGRSLGPWVAAMSAEASDMSGWLLMGLPGVAYWCGLSDAVWTAIGLAVGTYLNWLLVAKRLRRYSSVAGNAITIPDFFSNRFKEKKKIIILLFITLSLGSIFAKEVTINDAIEGTKLNSISLSFNLDHLYRIFKYFFQINRFCDKYIFKVNSCTTS